MRAQGWGLSGTQSPKGMAQPPVRGSQGCICRVRLDLGAARDAPSLSGSDNKGLCLAHPPYALWVGGEGLGVGGPAHCHLLGTRLAGGPTCGVLFPGRLHLVLVASARKRLILNTELLSCLAQLCPLSARARPVSGAYSLHPPHTTQQWQLWGPAPHSWILPVSHLSTEQELPTSPRIV